ncbi:synaptotagmin-11 isoform X1 [Drosophila sulfurigaster albostrigata]|uniref:synaptotagmin-11 isoform X1 n=1 Tax=Drosophila sulfurigaster albostrigata TaxID=89887 RepID=UPI002D21B794|nr:synaptotagmin-11 isoform X1 [Drosophila sulfurigaster albostrigata]XP_062131141.1 synaptotagmin-11 isoform X1 [Drosophila sulfurigaster albostrigata]
MSGLGPAACWLAHKRIESWSRMAKERVGAVRRVTLDRNSADEGSSASASASASVSCAPTLPGSEGVPSTTPPPPQPMTPPPSASSVTSTTSGIGSVSAGSVSDSCDLPTDSEEVNISKESQPIQPPTQLHGIPGVPNHPMPGDVMRGPAEVFHSPLHLHHQSRSFPPRLQRTPSISSQSSVDSAPSRQSGHRGSSPQIRTFGPDGRSSLPSEPAFPHHLARSPSPMRTISLDARCGSPASTDVSDLRTPSPSQSSLASLASAGPGVGVGSSGNMVMGAAGGSVGCKGVGVGGIGVAGGRCLSPLLIPPRAQPGVDPTVGPASPLGALQPDLYRMPDGPVYLTAPGTSHAVGRLHLRVKYDYHLFDLTVHLIEAHNLSPIEEGGFRDPYVRLMLQPDVDNRKRQTHIHRGESNPYFDQHFKFPVSRDQLQGKELVLQVLDYDRYSHNDIIGEVRISVDGLDLSKSVEIWGDLLRTKKPKEDRPELLCSLNYLPQAERLTIVIMKARNLDTLTEPYVKIYLIQNGKRIKKKKTSITKSDDPTNPIWNEAFTFNLQSNYLHNSAIEIYVVGAGSEATEIGCCGLGPQESGTGCQHWHDMINNARKPTAMWHYIR